MSECQCLAVADGSPLQYMFMVPLYFQAVRGDSPAAAGLRLMIPALATPIGGVVAGAWMQRGYPLCLNVRVGTATMVLGNILALCMGRTGARWKEFFYLVPANLGLGLTNPSVLFSFVSLFEHEGKSSIKTAMVAGAGGAHSRQSKRWRRRPCT